MPIHRRPQLASLIVTIGLCAALTSGCGNDSPTAPQPLATAVGAADRINNTVTLFDRTGTRFVEMALDTGTFSASQPTSHYGPDLNVRSVDAIALYSVGGDPQTFITTAAGSRLTYRYYDGLGVTWSALKDIAESQLGGCPFATIGAMYPEPTRMVVFEGDGHRYAFWTRSTNHWTRAFDFSTEFGGGKAPIDGVGAAFMAENNQAVLFDIEGTHFTVWNGSEFNSSHTAESFGKGGLKF